MCWALVSWCVNALILNILNSDFFTQIFSFANDANPFQMPKPMSTSGGICSSSFEKACSNPNPYSNRLPTKSRLLTPPKQRTKVQRPTPLFLTPTRVTRILTCTLHCYLPLPLLHGSPRLRIRPIRQNWHLTNLTLRRRTLRRKW